MKKLLQAFIILSVMMFAFTSCGDDNVDKSLIGQWVGTCTVTTPPSEVVLTFTRSHFSLTMDGSVRINSPYTAETASTGEKFIRWTEGTGGGDAVYYSVNGKTLSILGGNGSDILLFPKTLTKK